MITLEVKSENTQWANAVINAGESFYTTDAAINQINGLILHQIVMIIIEVMYV